LKESFGVEQSDAKMAILSPAVGKLNIDAHPGWCNAFAGILERTLAADRPVTGNAFDRTE
jgi:hypothetical protein